MKCPVYSGTPLMRTLWGSGEMSCVQWNPSIVDTLGPGEVSRIERCPRTFQVLVHNEKTYLGYSKVPLIQRCSYFRGVLYKGFHCIANNLCKLRVEFGIPRSHAYIAKSGASRLPLYSIQSLCTFYVTSTCDILCISYCSLTNCV